MTWLPGERVVDSQGHYGACQGNVSRINNVYQKIRRVPVVWTRIFYKSKNIVNYILRINNG